MTRSPKPPPRRSPARLAGLLAILAAVALAAWLARSPARNRPAPGGRDAGVLKQLLALEAREDAADAGVWAKELLAQHCGRVIEDLWNAVNAATNPLEALAQLEVGEVVLPQWEGPVEIAHGIRVLEQVDPPRGPAISPASWRSWLAARGAEGWRLRHVEFRHNRFDVDDQGRPLESLFGVRASLVRQPGQPAEERVALQGNLRVVWAPGARAEDPVSIRSAAPGGLRLAMRSGPPPFREVLSEAVLPPPKSHFVDPLILRDVDGDGRPEVILASANRVFRALPGDRFEAGPLCEPPPGAIFTAAIADFDGDGQDDFLSVKFEGFDLVPGDGRVPFRQAARRAWTAPERIRHGQALACGDVDGDGDLDVWFGQYKNPYDGGQMPTPYFDAKDGNPAYLLLNDGHGNFTDATAAAGLAGKRTRRTYAGSLVDLDGDGDLDLVVVSDFAGVEFYANDGRGRFTDVTAQRCASSEAFGMALAWADFNGDGRLDVFVTGMHCPTAQRLDHLGLARAERPENSAMRRLMAGGNKLLLAGGDGTFANDAFRAGVERTGWSWGCSAVDFDNDGQPDLAIANGHETRQSVADYEPHFWLHDIYVADSRENPVVAMYFAAQFARTRGAGMSYGGYEQNRLFLNRGGAAFVEAGHLLGVGMTEDSRNLAAADLDGDGRPELIVTTFEVWPAVRQTLHIFRNDLAPDNHWIGVRLREGPGCRPAAGATVAVKLAGGRSLVRPFVQGDAHRTQSAETVWFGLGSVAAVEAVEVNWAGGGRSTLAKPAINRVHEVPAPSRDPGATSRAR